jgi:histidine phosphotransferase ChpT
MALGDGLTRLDSMGAHLSRLVAARICHDLGGPLGGLDAALGEALGEAGDDPTALLLARDAALVLRRRLALFRAAWTGQPAPLTLADLHHLAGGLPNVARLHLDFDGLEDASFPAAAGPVVASGLLLAAECLPGGGMLCFAGRPDGVVMLTVDGPRAGWPVGLGALLVDAEAAQDAVGALTGEAGLRTMAGPMTALLAHEAGVRAGLLLAPQPERAPPLLLDFSRIAR